MLDQLNEFEEIVDERYDLKDAIAFLTSFPPSCYPVVYTNLMFVTSLSVTFCQSTFFQRLNILEEVMVYLFFGMTAIE